MKNPWDTIPGETPMDDISGLKIAGLSSRADLNRHEANNIRKAAVKYLAAPPSNRTAPFSYPWMFKLHKEMFGDVWAWAGKPRRSEKNLGVAPNLIEQSMLNLAEDLKVWPESDMTLVEQAALLHHRAVQIHPFENGNGRWSRLLTNIWLIKHGSEPTRWPEEHLGAVSIIREEYLKAIVTADQGDLTLLTDLHEKYID